MPLPDLLLIAVGLSLDAFAVAAAAGAANKTPSRKHAVKMAAFFGGFQAVMPALGWLAGSGLRQYMQRWAPLAAFSLLFLAGAHMIYGAFSRGKDENPANYFNTKILLALSVATSIDAFAVGVSLAMLKTGIIFPAACVGIVTFGLTYAGVYAGRAFGHILEDKAEILGGLVLVGLGVKILLEH